ncbi:MAG: helix-turn-helix domain-containing protein [Candidatus Magasanikbacteria bacterium]
MHIEILKKLGFSDKSAQVYLGLLALGPSSVRSLAKQVEMNRGSIYESLKWLREKGLVSFYEKDAKQFFVAEDPNKLRDLVTHQAEDLKEADKKITALLPELKSMHDKGGKRPVARYYEKNDVRKILEDVLDKCSSIPDAEYRVYSDARIREYLYEGFESFSDARIARGIKVKVIAIGDGGELRGLDERKWLKVKNITPTYTIIYAGQVAFVSLDAKHELVGVVIDNDGVYETQKQIFEELWRNS